MRTAVFIGIDGKVKAEIHCGSHVCWLAYNTKQDLIDVATELLRKAKELPDGKREANAGTYDASDLN